MDPWRRQALGPATGVEIERQAGGQPVMFKTSMVSLNSPWGYADPRFLYLSPSHREALASLYYGIDARTRVCGIDRQPGMGKTTLLFPPAATIRTSARTVFLFKPHAIRGIHEGFCCSNWL